MLTIADALRGINAYPIPDRTLEEIVQKRGIYPELAIDSEVLSSRAYRLCRADLLIWLAGAPAVSQGGQSYSFTDEQRKEMLNAAAKICEECGDDTQVSVRYGYKGNRL